MDENNKKFGETTDDYSLVKPTDRKGFWGRTVNWFVNLFRGWWYGMTDLFLASWANIVLLVMILVIPLIYGVVCAVGYWNPMENLGKVYLPIFDQDRTSIKVEDKAPVDGTENKFVYHIGAIDSIIDDSNNAVAIPDLGGSQDLSPANDFINKLNKGTYTLYLNNGFTVKITDGKAATGGTVSLSPFNSWDEIKNGLLVKKENNKSDTDAKFELGTGIAPNKEMHFTNIRYINDQDKIDKYWKTSKYQAQIKIAKDYGKTLLGMQGMAYAPDFAKVAAGIQTDLGQKQVIRPDGSIDVTKANTPELQSELKSLSNIKTLTGTKLPNIDLFQTFEKNFITAFVLGDLSQFATQIISQIAPFTSGFANEQIASETFGTPKEVLQKMLSDDNLTADGKKNQGIIDARNKLGNDSYYLVLTKQDFLNSINADAAKDFISTDMLNGQTLFDDNGKMISWLQDINNFSTNTGYEKIKADSSYGMQLIVDVENNFLNAKNKGSAPTAGTPLTNDQIKSFNKGIESLLTTPFKASDSKTGLTDGEILIQSLIQSFAPIYGTGPVKGPNGKTIVDTNGKFIPASEILKAEVPSAFKNLAVFADSTKQNKIKEFTSGNDGNLYRVFTNTLTDDEKTFFPFFDAVREIYDNQGTQKIMPNEMPVNILGTVFGQMKQATLSNGADTSKLLNIEDPRGNQIAVYGIGLGQMFLYIGTFVGFTMLRAALKRNKQYAKLTHISWYLSKMLQYIAIGLIQTTLTTWILYGAGWHQYISASAMCDLWAWFLESTLVLAAVICGLQYAINPGIGGALGVIFLALNVTCSGSSYPGWMEFGFYRGISYVMPFRYMIQGSDEIIYGVNLIHQNWGDLANSGVNPGHILHMANVNVLTQWGYSVCFFVFFFGIGLLGCNRAYKVSCYGSARGSVIAETLQALGRTEKLAKFQTTKTTKSGKTKTVYNWHVLRGPFEPIMFQTTRKIKGHKMSFKWYAEQRRKRKLEETDIYDR